MAWLVAQAVHLLSAVIYHLTALAVVHIPYLVLVRNWRRHVQPREPVDWAGATFWEGVVKHTRLKPVVHTFRYAVRIALIDLGKPPGWFRYQQKDHLAQGEAQDLAQTNGPVLLLTNPSSAGYAQNPLSVYYCYSKQLELIRCIAEVTNTPWGERVTFLFSPHGTTVPKSLHVSPMMDMNSFWMLKSDDPRRDREVILQVNAWHPDHGEYFYANLTMSKSPQPHHPNEMAAWKSARRYAFQPHRIAFWIYMHALRLVWKGVMLYEPPDPSFQQQLSMCPAGDGMRRLSSGAWFKWRPASA